jgi:hypothetical protein
MVMVEARKQPESRIKQSRSLTVAPIPFDAPLPKETVCGLVDDACHQFSQLEKISEKST